MYCSHKFLVSPDRSYNFTCVSSFVRSSIRSLFLKTMQNIFFLSMGNPMPRKILVLELSPKMFLTNQTAGFFKV